MFVILEIAIFKYFRHLISTPRSSYHCKVLTCYAKIDVSHNNYLIKM